MEYIELLNEIPFDEPIDRWALKEKAQLTDRECRRLIQEAGRL